MFEHELRVRYAETDQMGVVYYANYFVYFEAARTEHLRKLGISYSKLEKMGFFLPVVEAYCRYKKPARYEDTLRIRAWIGEVKRRTFKYHYEVIRDNELLAIGHTVHAFLSSEMKLIEIPEWIRKILEKER